MLNQTKNDLLSVTIFTLLTGGLGALLILIPEDVLLWLVFVALGLAIILFALPQFIHGIQYMQEEPLSDFVLTCLVLALGFALIFWQQPIVMIIIGVLLIGIPAFKIVTCNAKAAMFRVQLPLLILGVTLLLVGPGAFVNFLFTVAGWVIIALAAVYFLYSLVYIFTQGRSKAIQKEKRNIGDE